MLIKEFKIKNKINIIDFGNFLFSFGIFFLATAPFLSATVFLPALIIGSTKRKDNFFDDKWNYPFVAVSLLMIISCIVQNNQNYDLLGYDSSLSILGLFNWIPLFWCFWGFQPYLLTKKSRERTLLLILSGSIPVIITGLSQYFFQWYGPFDFFYGFIVWYQRPIDTATQGITALFNNQNYAGTWLSMVSYISLAFTIVKKDDPTKKVISLIISIFIFLTTFLTYSRNAISSIFIFLLFFIKSKRVIRFIVFFSISILLLLIIKQFSYPENIFSSTSEFIRLNLKAFLPQGLYKKIIQLINFREIKSLPRLIIWDYAINFISQKSLFGWGAGSFPMLFDPYDLGDIGIQHVHNLPFDIALSYGIPSSLILTFTLLLLTIKTFKKDFKLNHSIRFSKEYIFDTAWKTSIGIFLFSHLFDITYFDGRVSLFSWILFSGLRNILKEN